MKERNKDRKQYRERKKEVNRQAVQGWKRKRQSKEKKLIWDRNNEQKNKHIQE